MSKKTKTLFLLIPVLVSLFGLNNINQVNANTINTTNRLTIPTRANNRANETNSVLAQIQDGVKGQALITPNIAESVSFYLLGCFYYLNTTRDDTGTVVCQEAIVSCGTHITFYADTADSTLCEDGEEN